MRSHRNEQGRPAAVREQASPGARVTFPNRRPDLPPSGRPSRVSLGLLVRPIWRVRVIAGISPRRNVPFSGAFLLSLAAPPTGTPLRGQGSSGSSLEGTSDKGVDWVLALDPLEAVAWIPGTECAITFPLRDHQTRLVSVCGKDQVAEIFSTSARARRALRGPLGVGSFKVIVEELEKVMFN